MRYLVFWWQWCSPIPKVRNVSKLPEKIEAILLSRDFQKGFQLPLVSKSKNVVSWLLGWSLLQSIMSFSIKVSVDPLSSIVIKLFDESPESSNVIQNELV